MSDLWFANPGMESFLTWDRQVLAYLGDLADYVSLHRYMGNSNQDTADYLAISNSIDRQIEAVDSVCRYVAAKNGRGKRPGCL